MTVRPRMIGRATMYLNPSRVSAMKWRWRLASAGAVTAQHQ